MPFRTVLGFAAESRKIGRNEGDFGGLFTLKGKVRYLATGIVLPLDAWDDSEQHIVSTYPDSDALQMRITAKRLEIEKKIQRLEALDADVNFDTLFGQKSRYINCTISEYFQQQIEYLKGIGKVGTAGKYETCKSLLEQCVWERSSSGRWICSFCWTLKHT